MASRVKHRVRDGGARTGDADLACTQNSHRYLRVRLAKDRDVYPWYVGVHRNVVLGQARVHDATSAWVDKSRLHEAEPNAHHDATAQLAGRGSGLTTVPMSNTPTHRVTRISPVSTSPVHLMKKTHKIEVVRELDSRGFFTIREAVDLVAQRLKVSRFTVYNYLKEIEESTSAT